MIDKCLSCQQIVNYLNMTILCNVYEILIQYFKHTAELLSRERPLSATSARVPNIYSGVESEEEKRRARSQQAMYRRLFMDIEREQVKENIRRQDHRKRIQRYTFIFLSTSFQF